MQRIAFPTLVTTFLAFGPAFAGPLNLNPQTQPAANSAPIGHRFDLRGAAAGRAGAACATPRPSSSYGGGFIEMLFRGPGGAAPQPQYQPEPQLRSSRSTAAAHTNDQDVGDPRSRGR